MEKFFMALMKMVGLVILAGIVLLVLLGVVKLSIFLFTVALIVTGFALALIIIIALIVALVEMIRKIWFQKETDKKP
jgi:hypothetical protein